MSSLHEGDFQVHDSLKRYESILVRWYGLFYLEKKKHVEIKKNVLSINSSGFWFISTENVRDYGGFWHVLGRS